MPLNCVGQMSPALTGAINLPSRYVDINHIGRGATCVVLRAHDSFLDRAVAIKHVKPELTDVNSVLRFQQEAKVMSGFNLMHLPVVLDFGLSNCGRPYMVMEFVDGISLKDLIKQEGKLAVGMAIELAIHILSALEHAHGRGIIHRDLKAQNVMVSRREDGSAIAKVVDFGLASGVHRNGQITAAGVALGIPIYMSPEQAKGRASDSRSDIYSFGCVFFEMLTGTTPFEFDTLAETLDAHIRVAAPPLSSKLYVDDGGVFDELERLLAKCLEKDPSSRHQSAGELKEELILIREQLDPDETKCLLSLLRTHREGTTNAVRDDAGLEMPSANSAGLTGILLAMAIFVASCCLLVLADESFLRILQAAPLPVEIDDFNFAVLYQVPGPGAEALSGGKPEIFRNGRFQIVENDFLALPQTDDSDLKEIRKHPEVRFVNLMTSHSITGGGLHEIKDLPIERLDLRSLIITQEGFDAIRELPNLKTLRIDYMDCLTSSKLARLKESKTLTCLSLCGVRLSKQCQIEISRIQRLERLTLDHAIGLDDSSLDLFAKMPSLKRLSISFCKGVTPSGIARFRSARPEVALDI